MPRPRSPERDKAKQLWLESNKKRQLKDIASELNVSESQIRKWKNLDRWDKVTLPNAKGNVPKQKDGRKGNRNATGPPKNQHALKHGLFSKWLPDEVQEIVGSLSSVSPIDILWDNIQLQYAAIIRAQKIMWVRNSSDHDTSNTDEAYALKTASEKQDTFMSSQSRAMKTLESMIKQYEEMSHKNWNNVTDEQKERINLLKAQTSKLQKDDSIPNDGAQESMDAVSGIVAQMQTIEDDEV